MTTQTRLLTLVAVSSRRRETSTFAGVGFSIQGVRLSAF